MLGIEILFGDGSHVFSHICLFWCLFHVKVNFCVRLRTIMVVAPLVGMVFFVLVFVIVSGARILCILLSILSSVNLWEKISFRLCSLDFLSLFLVNLNTD